MTDYPVIFSAPMIRALLEGRKQMTRRLAWTGKKNIFAAGIPSPWQKAQPGDRLWVRETVKAVEDEDFDHCIHYEADHDLRIVAPNYDRESNAFGNWFNLLAYRSDDPDLTGGKLVPPIHMPRWASRLTLVVTATKIERLQDISEADAEAEGIYERHAIGDDPVHDAWTWQATGWRYPTARNAFFALWIALHGEESFSANPELVCLSFTVHKFNIDQMKEAA